MAVAARSVARRPATARQEFSAKGYLAKISQQRNPPRSPMDYATDAKNQWTQWHLEVSGLVTDRLVSRWRAQIDARRGQQITRHDCVEGWSVIGKWKGVRLEEIMNKVQPAAAVQYVVIRLHGYG